MSNVNIEEARAEAGLLKIDEKARTISKYLGTFDGIANWRLEVPNGRFLIMSTSGAGTNSCSVTVEGKEVFHANHYGHFIDCFRKGKWIEEFERLYVNSLEFKSAKEALDSTEEIRRLESRFSPIEL